jgi:anti-sigma regulatory factor (Ser/Thr protein kinase)/GNAT superfamily N-acetyltransferase
LTTTEQEAPNPENTIARVAVADDPELVPTVVDFARSVTEQVGLEAEAASRLGQTLGEVCRNVIEYGFSPDEAQRYEVEILRRPGRVVVAVEDMGLPFDYSHLGEIADQGVFGDSFVDEVRLLNLGRGGNRVELVKLLPHVHIREHLSEDEHHRTVQAPAVPEDASYEIRPMRPEESPELSRCIYRSYGYSYDWDYVYYPDRIRELQEGGLMRSYVAVAPGDEIVGHIAMRVEYPEDPIGEAGQAVVDPRYRGHHLFPKMMTYMLEQARNDGVYGLYGEATAVHPYSQKGSLELGAKETGFLLGYIPGSVSYKEIRKDMEGRRGSAALLYTRTNPEPERTVYPPATHREMVRRIVEYNGLRRTIGSDTGSQMPPSSRITVEVRRDHNLAFLRVEEPGADLQDLVRVRLRELCLHRIDCIYVDLPLSHPTVQDAGARLHELGFFFGAILPELRDGDVLRLQYLNEVDIRPEDVRTASDFGQELFDLVLEEKSSTEH